MPLGSIFSWRRLGADERGVAVVEFGLLAPVLALFVVAMIDLSQGFAERFAMQQAVNRSLELLLVNAPSAGANEDEVDYEGIRQEAATAAGVPIEQVVLRPYMLCGSRVLDDHDAVCADDEETARYVSLTVNKNFTGTLYVGTVPLVATGSMRVQ
jgi:Flp pilus assembly pilin Flp